MRVSNKFGLRKKIKSSNEAYRKYFLVFEGEETEPKYFQEAISRKKEIGINPIIELIPITKHFSEKGWSNPKKILDRIILDIECSNSKDMMVETFINRFIEFLYEENIINSYNKQAKLIWKLLFDQIFKRFNLSKEDIINDIESVCTEAISCIENNYNIEGIMINLLDMIKLQDITYSDGFDKICLIVDRDQYSFVSDQYDYVLKTCNERKYGFYLSNPCFEFWLLLHFDKTLTLDHKKLLANRKVTKTCRYTEQLLKECLGQYKKNKFNAKLLIDNLDKAIINEKKYCEDIKGLKTELGSNIGLLFEELRT